MHTNGCYARKTMIEFKETFFLFSSFRLAHLHDMSNGKFCEILSNNFVYHLASQLSKNTIP